MIGIKLTLLVFVLGCVSGLVSSAVSYIITFNKFFSISSLCLIIAGIMNSIVCFDMIPEAITISNMLYTILGIVLGIFVVFLVDVKNNKNVSYKNSNYILVISMIIHNIVEGIIIGAGFTLSKSLGISILISMFFHDIPECLIVSINVFNHNKNKLKNLLLNCFVGASSCIGTYIGYIFGDFSKIFVALLLSIASGTMLYGVSNNLISSLDTKNKYIYLWYVAGMIIGILITKY